MQIIILLEKLHWRDDTDFIPAEMENAAILKFIHCPREYLDAESCEKKGRTQKLAGNDINERRLKDK